MSAANSFHEAIKEQQSHNIEGPQRCLEAWFLGPKGENRLEFNNFVATILNAYEDFRASYQPADPLHVTRDIRQSSSFAKEMKILETELKRLTEELKNSVPFFSFRYKGHMLWETSLPSMLGYLSGMLWNQNNVDTSSSPVTAMVEAKVGRQLCDMFDFGQGDNITPWGHITSCGSVANIEAFWAARNLKFHPIALKNAIAADGRLASAKDTTRVYIPSLDQCVRLMEADNWDLLNMEVDHICAMTYAVAEQCGLSMAAITAILDSYSQASIGLSDFLKLNEINSPVVISPATNHYSWSKAATLLGLGYTNLIQVPVDCNGRLDLQELERLLSHCLVQNIPVLCVVAVVGTTEEGAVDPVTGILQARDQFKRQGLNFCIHADAAWGGYLMTMLKDSAGKVPEERKRSNDNKENSNIMSEMPRRTHSIPADLDRVIMQSLSNNEYTSRGRLVSARKADESTAADAATTIPLSPYARQQFQSLRMVDTITVDPHKAGFCVYPSGALCYRNGTMRNFIALKAPEVFHGDGEPSIGVYGLEGSKPGAAATSVLLSHNVIGLDKNGYGKIFGQCMLATKLFYCMWMTIAEERDPFVCVNFLDVHRDSDVKGFIRKNICGKTNKEIFKDKDALKFLAEVGPDALINTFAINWKNEDGSLNTDINVANDLQSEIFKELSVQIGLPTKRIPMYLTMSEFDTCKYGTSLDDFKRRLGIVEYTKKRNLKFLRSTVINPFQSTNLFVERIRAFFYNTVLNCIGKIRDEPYRHEFVSGRLSKNGFLYCSNLPSFKQRERQYHTALRFQIVDRVTVFKLKRMETAGKVSRIILKISKAMKMQDIVRSRQVLAFDLFVYTVTQGVKNEGTKLHLKNVELLVDDVFRHEHLLHQAADTDYPISQTYFLFGDKDEVYISHCITKKPDFFQLVQLDARPHSLSAEVVDSGVEVTILDVRGSPLMYEGSIQDPLQAQTYQVVLTGMDNVQIHTEIGLHMDRCKIWFQEIV